MSAAEQPTEVARLEETVTTWPERARALEIVDQPTYARAGEMLTGIKSLRAEIAEACNPVVEAAHRAHAAACKQKRDLEAPLVEAENALKGSMSLYLAAEDRKRREAEALLAAEAKRIEEEQQMREALALEAAGETEAAEAVIAAPIVAPAIVLPRPMAAGVAVRKVWKHRVVNAAKVPDAYKVIDEKKIAGVVRQLGQAANIPGVEVYADTQIAAGRR